jgi:uncharacterized phage-associated protein
MSFSCDKVSFRRKQMGAVSVHDVAAYIISNVRKPISTWKLQKLVYYSQAWSLVWDEKRLFNAKIEAWANGPVVPKLYNSHKGKFRVSKWPDGDSSKLNSTQKETVDGVIKYYGKKTGQELSDLTHREVPWKEARQGLNCDERGNREISLESMDRYYSSIQE